MKWVKNDISHSISPVSVSKLCWAFLLHDGIDMILAIGSLHHSLITKYLKGIVKDFELEQCGQPHSSSGSKGIDTYLLPGMQKFVQIGWAFQQW